MSNDTFIFFGTPSVASQTLAKLLEGGLVPTLVVCAPDAPKGRGLILTPCETKVLALDNNLSIFTPEKLDANALEHIKEYNAEYALVVAYGKIFPEALIAQFPGGVLNVHYSLLPKYRGATPLESALRSGDKETGVTIQKMVKALDAGDIIAQRSTPITFTDTAKDLRPRLILIGAELLLETLPAYIAGDIQTTPQNAGDATHSGKLKKEDGLLDLSAPGIENWNTYRAYNDSIGTYFFKNGTRFKLVSASYTNGIFRIDRVIPEGKREMPFVL